MSSWVGESDRKPGRGDHFEAPEGPQPTQDWVAWLEGEAADEAAWVAALEADWDDFGGVWSLLAGPDGG